MEQGGKIPLRPIGRTVALNGQPDHSRIPVPQNPALEAMARITEHLGGLLAEQSQKLDRQKAAMNNAELQNGIKEMQNELAQAQTAEEFDLCKKGFLGENGKPGTLMEKAKARLGSRLYSEWEKTDGAAFMKAAQIEADSQQLAFNRRLALANAKAALPGMVDNYVNARGNNALRQNIEKNFAETISVLPPEKQAEFNAAFKHDADYAFAEKNFDIPENEDINATIERLKKFETDLYAKHDKTGMLSHWTNLRPEERRRFAEKAKAIRQGLEQHQQREKEKAKILKLSEEEKQRKEAAKLSEAIDERQFLISKYGKNGPVERARLYDTQMQQFYDGKGQYGDEALPLALEKMAYLRQLMANPDTAYKSSNGSIKFYIEPKEYSEMTKKETGLINSYVMRIAAGDDKAIRKSNTLLGRGAFYVSSWAAKLDKASPADTSDLFAYLYDELLRQAKTNGISINSGASHANIAAVLSPAWREALVRFYAERRKNSDVPPEALKIATLGIPVSVMDSNNAVQFPGEIDRKETKK